MAPRTTWTNLLPGLAILAVIILIALGVLTFAGVGQIRGKKIHLYLATSQARGLLRGSEVWIAGQKAGLVDGVEFGPPMGDSTGRIVIAFSVRARDAQQIRNDSRADIRAGASIIAPVVVYLEAGTPGSPAVKDGDTLRTVAASDFASATARLGAAKQNLDPIMRDARAVIASVKNPNGTVGAALRDRDGGQVARLRAQVARLRDRMAAGSSPARSALLARASSALARTDSVRELLNSPSSSFGRFSRDSTLGAAIAGIRDELATVQSRLADAKGSENRFKSDSALTRALAQARREMTLLFDDIRRRPHRYIAF